MDSSKACITCPLTGFEFSMNKRFILCAAFSVIWFNLFSWFWHGNIMASDYQATAQLWKPVMDTGLITLGMSMLAIFSSYIFLKGYSGSGAREGLRYGVIMTLLFGGLALVTVATQPIPMSVIQMWVAGDLIQYTVQGTLLAILLKKGV